MDAISVDCSRGCVEEALAQYLAPKPARMQQQQRLKAVAAAHPAVRPIAYADDTYLIGPGPVVTAAFHTLVQHSATIGLAPSLHKSAVSGTPSTPAYTVA
jgi:hypothetical protein